jgi:thymidylate synthase (FAD)
MVKVISQSYEILTPIDGVAILKGIELAARTCYKSEGMITKNEESAKKLVKKLVENEHFAMVEHGQNITVKFITDRGVSHELVRHRLASFAQESTRYCNYAKDSFGNEITVILPVLDEKLYDEFMPIWINAMKTAEKEYLTLINLRYSPQLARSVLPNSLKTEIVVSANIREWRHILELRTSQAAHPQIRALMIPLLIEFKRRIPILFDDF